MPFEHDIGDSTPENNPEHSEIALLTATIKRQKRKFDWAIDVQNNELAESYHRRIITLEFLLRELGE